MSISIRFGTVRKCGRSACTSFFTLIMGVVLGYGIRQQYISEGSIARDCLHGQRIFAGERRLKGLDNNMKLLSLSEYQYSCNAQKAFEELNSLHIKTQELEKRKRRGEANRSRQAIITRKAAAASAAENAFRKCTESMMPELLKLWEDKLKRGEVNSGVWNDEVEDKIDGITFALLEETADTLDTK